MVTNDTFATADGFYGDSNYTVSECASLSTIYCV